MLWELLVAVMLKGALLSVAALAALLLLRRAPASARHWLLFWVLASMASLPVWAILSPMMTAVVTTPVVLLPVPPTLFSITVTAGEGVDTAAWLTGIWLAVAAMLLARLAAAQWFVSRICARATLRGEFRGVPVRTSAGITMPFTYGLWRPHILLPEAAAEWSDDRRAVVLLHEFAHAARRDMLARSIGELACAIHWMNPLAWLALRWMAAEQEHACDDWVLRDGVRATDYAGHLVEIARTFPATRPWPAAALGMAGTSQLQPRVKAILSATRSRTALTRRQAAVAACGVVLVALPVAALRPDYAGALSGRLHDGIGIVPGATVMVSGPQGSRTATTDATGNFRIGGLAPGRHQVRFRAPGFAEAVAQVVVTSGREVRIQPLLRLGEARSQLDVVAAGNPPGAASAVARRVRVGGQVQSSKLLHMVRPLYPEEAKRAGIAGRVMLRAVIDAGGNLKDVQVADAPHELLAQAATNAVKQWRYVPTHLNGQPVEVETMIAVNFQLNP